MNSLSMVEAKLPPGFRFHPRDDELVCDYLIKKWNGSESALLVEVDLNKCEPWDLPEIACVGGKEWYFYSQRDKKYATGLRTNRATISGYWKATGKDRPIVRKGSLVGMRKTLVFYRGRAPKGKKTDWVMHEFRVEGPFGPPKISTTKEDWVLCRVFYKNRDQVPSKSIMGNDSNTYNNINNNDDEIIGSTSLPPLMDSYISFDQTIPNNTDTNYQQVPCFSMYTSSSSPIQNKNDINLNPTLPPYIFQLHPNITTKSPTFGNNIMLTNDALNNAMPCDKKMIEAVLSHLTKMENSPTIKESPTSLGEAASSESFLSDIALPPNMWSHY